MRMERALEGTRQNIRTCREWESCRAAAAGWLGENLPGSTRRKGVAAATRVKGVDAIAPRLRAIRAPPTSRLRQDSTAEGGEFKQARMGTTFTWSRARNGRDHKRDGAFKVRHMARAFVSTLICASDRLASMMRSRGCTSSPVRRKSARRHTHQRSSSSYPKSDPGTWYPAR